MALVVSILKEVLKAVMLSILTESFIKEVILYALESLAKRTTNEVDDKLVDMVRKAMYKQPAPQVEEPKA